MVPRERFINKLQEIGFLPSTPCGQRVMLMKRRIDSAIVSIPLKELLEDGLVYKALCQHGVSAEDAEGFVDSNQR